jgi:hypothetical protein
MERNEFVGYAETHRVLDNFLNKSGIRRICREECKGDCCSGCKDNKPKTVEEQKTCGQNLSCMSFVCYNIYSPLCESSHNEYRKMDDSLRAITNKHGEMIRRIASRNSEFSSIPYYKPDNTSINKSSFKIEKKWINVLKDETLAKKIRLCLESNKRIKSFIKQKRKENKNKAK